jgi:RluA family pseudouridine synthase
VIIYQDERLVAVAKPSGCSVIMDRIRAEEPLADQVGRLIGTRALVVHRLDRGASGLVIFAKDAATHRALNDMFAARAIHKSYLVAVSGRVESDGVVDRPLRVFGSGRVGVCPADDPRAKPSLSRYRILGLGSDASLLQVEPSTGRRHQIRVHLYSIGHPVLGDNRYGSPRPVGGALRLMLHAWRLGFDLEGRGYSLCAPPGDDFVRLAEARGLKMDPNFWPA